MGSQSTKATKVRREKLLTEFLEEIKSHGTWLDWLNRDGELYVSKVCKHLGMLEGNKAWEASFLRGTGWGVPFKDEFNKWAYENRRGNTDLFGHVVDDSLPSWLNLNTVPTDVTNFILDQVKESKRLREKITALGRQCNTKDRKILELEAELESVINRYRANEDHYLFSIRSLSYD